MNLQLGWVLEHSMLMVVPACRSIAHALDGAVGCLKPLGGVLDHGCQMPVAIALVCRSG
jgi:hypothetical protein